jgi:hypothetical protein
MYTVTSLPLERRTRVIFRRAEFGFFGVIVRTCKKRLAFVGSVLIQVLLIACAVFYDVYERVDLSLA